MFVDLISLVVTVAVIAFQYQCGLRKKARWAVILPIIFLLLFLVLSYIAMNLGFLLSGLMCVFGLAVTYLIGRTRARAKAKADLDKMKAKDL